MSKIKNTRLYKKALEDILTDDVKEELKKVFGDMPIHIGGFDYSSHGSEYNNDNSQILKNLDDKFEKLYLCLNFLDNIPSELELVEQSNHLEYHLSFLQKEMASIFDILLKLIKFNYNLNLPKKLYYGEKFKKELNAFSKIKNSVISLREEKYKEIFSEQNFIKHARDIIVDETHSVKQMISKVAKLSASKYKRKKFDEQKLEENHKIIELYKQKAINFENDVLDIIEQICKDKK